MSKALHETHSLWSLWERLASCVDVFQPLLIRAEDGTGFSYTQLSQLCDRYVLELHNSKAKGALACTLANGPDWLAWLLACAREGKPFIALDPANHAHARATAERLGAGMLVSEKSIRVLEQAPGGDAEAWAVGKVTSGSTKAPKLVKCRASHLIADGEQIIATMGIRAGDRNFALIPFGFSYGLGNLVMPLLIQGTPVVYCESFLLGQLPEWMECHGVTVLPSVPGIFRMLTTAVTGLPECLRLCISAGAPLPVEVAQEFSGAFGRRIHNFYGSSETGGICYDCDGEASLEGRSVGSPMSGVSVEVDAEGAITVRSPAVAMPEQAWTLPDRGEMTGGKLRLLGRTDRMLNLNGKKLNPAELESLLREHPAISDAFVFLRGDETRPRLCAAVETQLSRAEVASHLSGKVPDWQLPRQILLCEHLPRNARGKITRDAVLALPA